MSYRNLSQIRGFGTLSRVVGPNTSRLANLGYLDDEEHDMVSPISSERSNVQCPICWVYFDKGVNEVAMSQHVSDCLAKSKVVAVSQKIPNSVPDEIDLVDIEEVLVNHRPIISKNPPQNTFETLIVGRRYSEMAGIKPQLQQKFEIRWEPDNAYDPDAILAISLENGRSLGHLPRKVAAKLGPLLRNGKLSGSGIVLQESEKPNENVAVQITLKALEGFKDMYSIIQELGSGTNGDSQYITEASVKLLDRLKHIFQTVERIESKALGEGDHRFLSRFRSLSTPCQLLFAKLCERNKRYFSVQKMSTDGQERRKQVDDLLQIGLFASVDISSSDVSNAMKSVILSDIFQNKDLRAILDSNASLCKSRSMKRCDLISHIVMKMQKKFSFDGFCGTRVCQEILKISGGIFEISRSEFRSYHRIQRLFFLNEGHSLATWHGVDEGFLRYPKYEITREKEVFANQKAFLDYERSLFHAQKLIAAIERNDEDGVHSSLAPAWKILDCQLNKTIDHSDTINPPFLLQYNCKWVYTVMATIGIGILERKKEYKIAIERLQQLLGGVYCYERRGYWWIRLSTNLEHLGRPTDSLELAETALADSSIRLDEKLTLRRRVLKLSKPPRRWKNPIWIHEMPKEPLTVYVEARPLPNTRGERCKFVGYDSSICSVEQLALQYYQMEENGAYQGIHSESGIWCTLFTLLLWPALFEASVPDTFRTLFQTAPLDLGHPGFYDTRRPIIDHVFEEIRSGKASELIEKSWKANYGVAVRGITWERYNLSTIQDIATSIGGSGITAVCRLFCEDYSNVTSGMPDLLLWNGTSCKLAEVKSTRDTLSDKQRAWISFLENAGIPCEVLKITESTSSNSRAKRSRS